MPKISVLLPLYDTPEAYLCACLDGRIKLTRRETEIARLLADGCSRNKIARLMRVHPATVKSFIQKSPQLREWTDA